jgi:hypothetical protein
VGCHSVISAPNPRPCGSTASLILAPYPPVRSSFKQGPSAFAVAEVTGSIRQEFCCVHACIIKG